MKKMLHKGFNPAKCKTSLKMAVSRLKLLRNKKEIQLTQLKREVAQLLETGQDQTARIRVEHVVREEKTITAYELIDIYCELIVARLPIIETQKNCPIDLKEAIASIIFATPRCSDIPELVDIRKHFTAKYGKEFVTAAVELRPDCGVNRTLIEKLSANAPDGPTKVKILTGIAEEHKIKWEPNWFKDNEPESPAHVPNTEKISKMHVEPQSFQAAPISEPKPENPSNIVHHAAGPEGNDPKFAYFAARPVQGTHPETVESSQSPVGAGNSSFGARQKWNMEFKDASAAAHAAAESAEMASMAARAAAELATRGKFVDSSADSNFVQNERNRVHIAKTNQGGFADKYSEDNSSRERPSRTGHVQRDPSIDVKPSGIMDENNIKKEYRQTVSKDTPIFSQQSNSPKKAVQKDEYQPKRDHRQSLEYQPKRDHRQSLEYQPKRDHRQSLERYDELQDNVEIEEQDDTDHEDSKLWESTTSQAASKYDHDIFSHSNRRHDDGSVENPFHEDVETRNQPSSYPSQSSGLSENYGVIGSSDPPKFDDDLYEDPFDSTGRGDFYKDDFETKEPSEESAFHSTVFQDRKEDNFAFSEQRKSAFESHKHLFADEDNEHTHTEKETMNDRSNDAAPHFDDYVADEDDYIRSPGTKSPDYSSPDEERLPKKFGVLSTKHLYQPELTESFKKGPLYSQLDKPISLGDESDDSENDEEVKKSEIHERTSDRSTRYSFKEPETEHTIANEVVGSSYGRRGTASIISEELTIEQRSEENLEQDSGYLIRKKPGSGDLSTRQQSSRSARARSDAKSFDRLLEEAEETEHTKANEVVGSSYGRRGTASIISEESTIEQRSEENLEQDSGDLIGKKSGSGDLSIRQQSSRSARARSDAKSFDRQSFSRLLEEAERLSSPRRSPLQATPDVIDESEDSYQSNTVSTIELNVDSLSGGLKNKGLRRPPYIPSSVIKDLPSKKESTPKKTTSSFGGTYLDPNGDDTLEDGEWKGKISIQNSSDKKISDNLNQRSSSRVPKSSYLDSEDISSEEEEAVKQTVPSKYRSVAGSSRRTRAGPSYAAGSQTKSRTSSALEKESSSSTSFAVDTSVKPRTKPVIQMESLEPRRRNDSTKPSQTEPRASYNVSEKDTSSSSSFAVDTSVKPKTKSVIQKESLEPRRRDDKTRTSNPSKMSSGEEISASDAPKTSSSIEKTLSRESSDKRASHVHPKLPDYDDFASHLRSLRKDRQ